MKLYKSFAIVFRFIFVVGLCVLILLVTDRISASEPHAANGVPQSPTDPPCSDKCCDAPGSGSSSLGSMPGGVMAGMLGGVSGTEYPSQPSPATTIAPVFLMRGAIVESATDLSVPGPLGGWKHQRTYDSLLDPRTANNSNYNFHGRRWTGGPQGMYLRRNGSTMELFLTASSMRTFTDNDPGKSNGTFTGPADFKATLTKSIGVDYAANEDGEVDTSIPLSYLVYTLTYPDTGEVYIFKEKDPTDPCWGITGTNMKIVPLVERTNRSYLSQGLIGETYHYNTAGQLVLTVTASPQSYFVKYLYLATGAAVGCLQKIEVFDGPPGSEGTTKFAETEYTYCPYTSFHGEYPAGNRGDLSQVKISELLSDGVSWEHRYTQYRNYWYYSEGSYQLKAVYEPDAIERIMQENSEIAQPETLLYMQDYNSLSSGKTLESYASRSFAYHFNADVWTNSISTAWRIENLDTKYGGSRRPVIQYVPYNIGMVKRETINTGCSSCGGSNGGGKAMDYYYLYVNSPPANDVSGDPNVVVYLTIEDTRNSVGTPVYRTIYGLNWHGIELRKAVIENPYAATLNAVCTSKILDAQGRIVEQRPEAAHTLIDTDAELRQFLNPFDGSSWANDQATLEPSKGIIRICEYDSVTGKPSAMKIKVGVSGAAYYIAAADYNTQGQVAAEYGYPTQTTNREAADRVSTTYAYTYWDNSKQAVKTITATGTPVPTAQNGTGVAAVSKVFYDSYGKVRWTQDALGVVAYQGYHPLTLQRTLTVRDVDTGSLPAVITTDSENIAAWTGAAPLTRNNALAAALNATSTVEYDIAGRANASTGPDGVTSYTIRAARKTMRFPAWDTSTQKPILPISVTEVNAAGKPVSTYELPPTGVLVTDGKPTGVQANAAKNVWTRYHYGSGGSLEQVDQYHTIPASGDGALGTNYYRTTMIHDRQGRQVATARFVQTGKWQVDYQKLDWLGRPVEQMQGVAMNAPSYADFDATAWLATVSKTVYDGDHVERTLSYFDTGANDYIGTRYHRDAWDRLRAASQYHVSGGETSFSPYTVHDYDWRSNVVATAVFETEPNWTSVTSTDDFAATTASGRRGLSKTYFDILGNPYRSETYEVATNGVAGICATANSYRNANGRKIASERINGPRNETDYDALGRTVVNKTVFNNDITTVSLTEYGGDGRMTGTHAMTLNPGVVGGIDMNGTNFVRNTQYFWYDNAGRLTTRADYGCGGAVWANFAKPTRSATPPTESSAVALVTKTLYNADTGRGESSTDAAGRDHKTVTDALARTVTQFQNYKTGSSGAADEDVEVRFTYDGIGNLLTLTSVNPTTGNQVTRYLYEDIYDASLQTSAIYPDSSDNSSSGTDQVKTAYYLDGNVKTVTDQNGTVRTFSYDTQRRLASDHAGTLGAGVDGTVRKIGRSYAWNGAVSGIASYDSNNAVLNEIKYEYDANQKLARLYQSHSGAANVNSTPYLAYQYDDVTEGFRLVGQTYPSGKILSYQYDRRDNITTIAAGNGELQPAVVEYLYDGAGSPMQTTYTEPDLSLAYTGGGLDRFGRIINHAWMKNAAPLAHIIHGYDYSGNRTSRYDAVHAADSELYEYDQTNQIKNLNRGILNQARTEVATSNFTESWNFDKTGNWNSYDKNGTAETRTHNAANELQGIATHDANGNMTLMPGLKGKYDAWNRLVEVRTALDALIARYEYNGLNHRIANKIYVDNALAETRQYFYNESWQCLEERVGGNVDRLYVWGADGIDDMICRERVEERLYPLTDPNGNVVAIVDKTGEVKERYCYDAFGKARVLNPDFTDKSGSEFDWDYLYTSRQHDAESSLIHYRNRYHNPLLGRFINRDPIEYEAGDVNLYRYVANSPLLYLDPFGLEIVISDKYCPKDKKKVEDDLMKLDEDFIKELEDSPYVITIEPADDGNAAMPDSYDDASNKKKGSGGTVWYDPNNRVGGEDDKGNTDREPRIGLAHELGHAEDFIKGKFPKINWRGKPIIRTNPNREKNALRRENEQRKREGATPRRNYYPKRKLPWDQMPIWLT